MSSLHEEGRVQLPAAVPARGRRKGSTIEELLRRESREQQIVLAAEPNLSLMDVSRSHQNRRATGELPVQVIGHKPLGKRGSERGGTWVHLKRRAVCREITETTLTLRVIAGKLISPGLAGKCDTHPRFECGSDQLRVTRSMRERLGDRADDATVERLDRKA